MRLCADDISVDAAQPYQAPILLFLQHSSQSVIKLYSFTALLTIMQMTNALLSQSFPSKLLF